jgi:hypothetical protein
VVQSVLWGSLRKHGQLGYACLRLPSSLCPISFFATISFYYY